MRRGTCRIEPVPRLGELLQGTPPPPPNKTTPPGPSKSIATKSPGQQKRSGAARVAPGGRKKKGVRQRRLRPCSISRAHQGSSASSNWAAPGSSAPLRGGHLEGPPALEAQRPRRPSALFSGRNYSSSDAEFVAGACCLCRFDQRCETHRSTSHVATPPRSKRPCARGGVAASSLEGGGFCVSGFRVGCLCFLVQWGAGWGKKVVFFFLFVFFCSAVCVVFLGVGWLIIAPVSKGADRWRGLSVDARSLAVVGP